jgi:hypothetical protein
MAAAGPWEDWAASGLGERDPERFAMSADMFRRWRGAMVSCELGERRMTADRRFFRRGKAERALGIGDARAKEGTCKCSTYTQWVSCRTHIGKSPDRPHPYQQKWAHLHCPLKRNFGYHRPPEGPAGRDFASAGMRGMRSWRQMESSLTLLHRARLQPHAREPIAQSFLRLVAVWLSYRWLCHSRLAVRMRPQRMISLPKLSRKTQKELSPGYSRLYRRSRSTSRFHQPQITYPLRHSRPQVCLPGRQRV